MNSSLFGMQARTAQEIAYIAMDFVSKNVVNIIGSVIILAASWVIAVFLGKFLQFFLLRRKADITITKFLVDVIKLIIILSALLIALGNFGITIAPFVAGLGALGFGVSFALQGPLSNYAAGVTLIFTKPFKVGDILEVNSQMGEVVNMTLARTIMKTLDDTHIIIPNKKIIGEIMHNYSGYKKLTIKIGVDYSSDIDKALNLVKDAVIKDTRVAIKPPVKIGILDFADSSITICARLWCKQSDYTELMFDINKRVLESFRKNNVTIPFPQRDVRIVTKEK